MVNQNRPFNWANFPILLKKLKHLLHFQQMAFNLKCSTFRVKKSMNVSKKKKEFLSLAM